MLWSGASVLWSHFLSSLFLTKTKHSRNGKLQRVQLDVFLQKSPSASSCSGGTPHLCPDSPPQRPLPSPGAPALPPGSLCSALCQGSFACVGSLRPGVLESHRISVTILLLRPPYRVGYGSGLPFPLLGPLKGCGFRLLPGWGGAAHPRVRACRLLAHTDTRFICVHTKPRGLCLCRLFGSAVS